MPLRTPLENGDQVEILVSKAQHPQPAWLSFVVTGKAKAKIRRFVKSKEREETIALGRKIFDEIVQRLPAPLGWEAMAEALRRLHLHDDDSLMEAIALKRIDDVHVMEALMPGSTGGKGMKPPPQRQAISIKGLTPGVAFDLAECCTRSPATESSAFAAKAPASRCIRSTATASPTASMPTGSISPGATNPTAAPPACASSSRTSPVRWRRSPASWAARREHRQPRPGQSRRRLSHLSSGRRGTSTFSI
jgi:hypothetical protein